METFEVRSKSYSVKWVKLPMKSELKWSIKPIKNSINLAIYKHLDQQQTGTPPPTMGSESILDTLSIDAVNQLSSKIFNIPTTITKGDTSVSYSSSTLPNGGELKFEHLKREYSIGRCPGDIVKNGSFISESGGLYAFIFDNTFSKTKSKKINFSYEQIKIDAKVKFDLPKTNIFTTTTSVNVNGVQFIQGYLLKKKRKKNGKAFNKRFFSLNLNYAILDYYINENSKNIRGNMLITQSVISADSLELMIYLDSGMEQWILKANNKEDFNLWITAFNLIKRKNVLQNQQSDILSINESVRYSRRWVSNPKFNQLNEKILNLKILIDESIDTAKQTTNEQINLTKSNISSIQEIPLARRSSFFSKLKKKNSTSLLEDIETFDLNNNNNNTTTTPPSSSTFSSPFPSPIINVSTSSSIKNHDLLTQLTNLKMKISELDEIYQNVKFDEDSRSESRKTSTRHSSISGNTSINSNEFYDAQEFINELDNGVVMLNDEDIIDEDIKFKQLDIASSEEEDDDDDDYEEEESEIGSEIDINSIKKISKEMSQMDLSPLPFNKPFKYRNDIKIANCEPPSIMSILRKGIGKDLTNMSMPITCNEPLSFLQKYCESFEYSNLINDSILLNDEERFINIGVFAISYLSSYRDKIRCLRKPFNPLLSETFELIRPEFDLRILCEKVIHKPFKMACHVESKKFQLNHTLEPIQNFYGKSADLIMNGKIKLQLSNGEIYEWSQPNTALRNMISLTGEKFTEPIDEFEIKCISNGSKLKIKFINESTRFSTIRSEKLEMYLNGIKVSNGKWTEFIKLNSGKEIWKVGKLVNNHKNKWGFTEFSCGLNNLDKIHEFCSPNDSRRRPDQKFYEDGLIEKAEQLKIKLEEDQRSRRLKGNEHPNFFKVNDDGNWSYIQGPKSYWNRRLNNDWDDLVKLW